MKPLGTITLYYQFLEKSTIDILDSLIMKSINYYSFLELITEYVESNDSPEELVQVAAVHLFRAGQPSMFIEKILKKYGKAPLIKPWTFFLRTFGERQASQDMIQNTIDDAIDLKPKDWFLFELYLLRFESYTDDMGPKIAILDTTIKFFEKRPELYMFFPRLSRCRMEISQDEGETTENHEALETARNLDDTLAVWMILLWQMVMVRFSDPQRALEMNEEKYKLAQELGLRNLQVSALNSMSWTYWSLGEYDLALECHAMATDNMDEYEKEFGTSDWRSNNITRLHCDMGNGQEASTWADWAVQEHFEKGGKGDSRLHIDSARAHILLGNLDVAAKQLDIAKELVFKQGFEGILGLYYNALGEFEVASGNLDAGKHSFDQALNIAERKHALFSMNRCLIALTKTEIAINVESGIDPWQEDSGENMRRLERVAREKKLTGILMQHSILKAEYRVAQDRLDDAKAILMDALNADDSPGVRTLRNRIEERLGELTQMT